MSEWHLDILPKSTRKALDYLKDATWLSQGKWYLAGGTALTLQVGHRQSVDLDFFTTNKTFLPTKVTRNLPETVWQADIVEEGTIYGKIHQAKVSFIAYPFFLPAKPKLKYGSVEILDKDDIAVMKIVALSQRGRKRDFLDLYWYVTHIAPLVSVIEKLPKQYPSVAHNYHHIIKSMTYFDDADKDLMPILLFETKWENVKKYFQNEVAKVAQEILKLNQL